MKVIGLVLIFISTTAVGFIKANRYRDTEKEISAFIQLIYFIKHEITLYLTPQIEIYDKFSSLPLESNGFMEMVRAFSRCGAETPLLRAVTECDTLRCGSEVVDILRDFSQTFGMLSVEEQCERCDRTAERLCEIHKRKKEEASEKTRLYRSVGCMAGLGLVLMLW